MLFFHYSLLRPTPYFMHKTIAPMPKRDCSLTTQLTHRRTIDVTLVSSDEDTTERTKSTLVFFQLARGSFCTRYATSCLHKISRCATRKNSPEVMPHTIVPAENPDNQGKRGGGRGRGRNSCSIPWALGALSATT